jgi:hypothetical protein
MTGLAAKGRGRVNALINASGSACQKRGGLTVRRLNGTRRLPPQRWLPAFLDLRDREAAVAALCLELDGVADLELLEHRAIPDLIDQRHVFLEAEARSRTLFHRDAPAALIDLLDLADNRCVLRNGATSQHGHQQRRTSHLLENFQNGLLFVSSVSSNDF